MINDVRTLLLNQDGDQTYPAGYPGEEYVPPAYRARTLSGPLGRIRRTLFGGRPDRAMLNLRLAQYLGVLAALEETRGFLTLEDVRITYRPGVRRDFFTAFLAGPTIVQTAGTTASLTVGGYSEARAQERCRHVFTLTVVDSDEVTRTWIDDLGVPHSETVVYATTDGLGGPVSLPGTDLWALFQPTSGAAWSITTLLIPQDGLAQVAARALTAAGSGDAFEELFVGGSPYDDFLALYQDHPSWPGRLAGLLLALAWRTREAT